METIQRFLIGDGELFYLDASGDEPMFTIEHYHVNKVICQKCVGGSGSVINSVDVRGVHRHVCDFDIVCVQDGYRSPMVGVDYEYFRETVNIYDSDGKFVATVESDEIKVEEQAPAPAAGKE